MQTCLSLKSTSAIICIQRWQSFCPSFSLDKSFFGLTKYQCKRWLYKLLIRWGLWGMSLSTYGHTQNPRNHSCKAMTRHFLRVDHGDEMKDGTRFYGTIDGNIGNLKSGNGMSGYMPGKSISGSRPTLVLSNSQLVRGLQDIGEVHHGFAEWIRLATLQPFFDLGTGADMDRILMFRSFVRDSKKEVAWNPKHGSVTSAFVWCEDCSNRLKIDRSCIYIYTHACILIYYRLYNICLYIYIIYIYVYMYTCIYIYIVNKNILSI